MLGRNFYLKVETGVEAGVVEMGSGEPDEEIDKLLETFRMSG